MSSAAAAAGVTVVHAGHLVDTEAGRVLADQTIVIRDGLIEAVGPAVPAPAGAQRVDLREYWVLPGLIDAHTHLTIDLHNQDPLAELQHTAAERALGALPNARAVLLAGFTTVRDLGSYRALVDVALRDAINRGDVVGPRMLVAGAYITISGGAGAVTGFAPDVTLPWDLRYGIADSPEEVRARVRALAGQRVDVIKMLATGAILTHNSNPSGRELTPEELAAGVDEARNFGLKVAVHAHGAAGIKAAIRAGAASIEHGTLMDDEGRALMKQHGTYLVPTLETRECVGSNYPPEFVAKASQLMTCAAGELPQGGRRGRENRLRYRHRRVRLRPQCSRVRLDGAERHDADAGHPGGHRGRCRPARARRQARGSQARQAGRPHRSARRPARRHPGARGRALRHEAGRDLQAGLSRVPSQR